MREDKGLTKQDWKEIAILLSLCLTASIAIIEFYSINSNNSQAPQPANVSKITNGNLTFRAIKENEILAIKRNAYIFVNCSGLADNLNGKTDYKNIGIPFGVIETCAQLEVGIADVNSYRYQEAFEKYHICYIVHDKAIGACEK